MNNVTIVETLKDAITDGSLDKSTVEDVCAVLGIDPEFDVRLSIRVEVTFEVEVPYDQLTSGGDIPSDHVRQMERAIAEELSTCARPALERTEDWYVDIRDVEEA